MTANRQFQFAIYTNNAAGKPGTLVATSASGTLTANAWNSIAIAACSPRTQVMADLQHERAQRSGQQHLILRAAAGQSVYSNARVTFGTWPATFPAATLVAARFSLFATIGQ